MKPLVLVFFLAVAASARATVTLPAIFSDHLVLLSGKPVPVWGAAAANEEVTVAIGSQKKTTKADASGKWSVKLDALAVSATPQTLTIGDKTIHDVLVGEVWLGSGQSNMAMTVQGAKDLEGSRKAANTPEIRMFVESSSASETAQTQGKGQWHVCSPETVGRFSATLYFFGRTLHDSLKVPVGLINSSVGGTPIESWIDKDVQLATPELKTYTEGLVAGQAGFEPEKAMALYKKQTVKWAEDVKTARAAGRDIPRKPKDPVQTRAHKGGVGGLFNGKIAPLIPYAIRGAIWYQGEANSQDAKVGHYQRQLTLLAADWRKRWGDEFAFGWVQLPNFIRAGEGWPLMREQMMNALQTIPRSGMATTIDIGEAKDIHPKNKQDVGWRLAQWALGTVYHKEVEAICGPLIDTVTAKGAEMVLTFKHSKGLNARGGLTGFEVAGADEKWQAAQAKIEGETVIVSASSVPEPKKVRYAWKDFPTATLFNGAGMPASTFRR